MTPVYEAIDRQIYHGTEEFTSYREARSTSTSTGPIKSFDWQGHRWAYGHTDFDDNGDFDVIYRHQVPLPKPEHRRPVFLWEVAEAVNAHRAGSCGAASPTG